MAIIRKLLLPFLLAALLSCVSCNNNLATALNDKVMLAETDPPVPGGSSLLTVGTVRATVLPLSWTKATDNLCAQADLEYKVVYSLQDNISTIADAAANGTVAVDWTKDFDASEVAGLTILTTYYVNVLVRDKAGNEAIYASVSGTTDTDTGIPTITSASFSIDSGSRTDNGFTLSWTPATDDITPTEKLAYQVYTSRSDNITKVEEAEKYGTAFFGAPAVNATSATLTGLWDGVKYYVNVVVQDEVGNKAAYVTGSETTVKHPRAYYVNQQSGTADTIERSDIPMYGEKEKLVTTGLSNPYAIAVDPIDRKIYWTDSGTKKIQRADFDGKNVEDLITSGLATPFGIAVDSSSPGRYLYWTDSTNKEIYRSPLPPSSPVAGDWILLGSAYVDTPYGIEVDLDTDEFYWVENGVTKKIRKAPASNPTSISDLIFEPGALTNPIDIALDDGIYYWTDRGSFKIQSHVYGTGSIKDLVTSQLSSPSGIAIGHFLDSGGKEQSRIYWCDADLGNIYEAPLNIVGQAANQFIAITGLINPRGIQEY